MSIDTMDKTIMGLQKSMKDTDRKLDELRKNKHANIAKCIIFVIFIVALIFHFSFKIKKHQKTPVQNDIV